MSTQPTAGPTGRIDLVAGRLTLFVTRTRLGLSMQALAEDLTAARLMGIRVDRVVIVAFAIASALAAVAGFLYASQAGQINPFLGFTPVLKAFIGPTTFSTRSRGLRS